MPTIEELENWWRNLPKKEKKKIANVYVTVSHQLKDDIRCDSVCPINILVDLDEGELVCSAPQDLDYDCCMLCNCFKEIRSKFTRPFKRHMVIRCCPCFTFGREKAIEQLKLLLERFKKEKLI